MIVRKSGDLPYSAQNRKDLRAKDLLEYGKKAIIFIFYWTYGLCSSFWAERWRYCFGRGYFERRQTASFFKRNKS
jgi:hypothetical protein